MKYTTITKHAFILLINCTFITQTESFFSQLQFSLKQIIKSFFIVSPLTNELNQKKILTLHNAMQGQYRFCKSIQEYHRQLENGTVIDYVNPYQQAKAPIDSVLLVESF
ncbi:MAG: hypothetical protein WD055_03905 [Candidatus Dependentiae bacterium]